MTETNHRPPRKASGRERRGRRFEKFFVWMKGSLDVKGSKVVVVDKSLSISKTIWTSSCFRPLSLSFSLYLISIFIANDGLLSKEVGVGRRMMIKLIIIVHDCED